jgi:hypothetical protein
MSLSGFKPLRRGNSPKSSGLILSKISVIRGEQSAQKVCVLKRVWISCLLPEVLKSFLRRSWDP